MIERIWVTVALGVICACDQGWAAGNVPDAPSAGVEPELTARMLLRSGAWTPYAEARGGSQVDDRHERYLMLGTYYRPWDHLKLGAFYQGQLGVRHDGDWVKTDVWHWDDVGSRFEHLLVLDASPRTELGFLPGENWVGELKTRYFRDFTVHEQSLVLRPGLTYFWLRDGQPFINFFAQYEMWFPIDFSTKTIYESWAYLGALYHCSDVVQLGAYGAFKRQFWTSTPGYTAVTGNTYEVEARSVVMGLLVVVQP